MHQNNGSEILIEITPVISLCGRQFLIKLPDSAYGEWLIFKKGNPVFYFNIFDSKYKKVKDLMDSNMVTFEQILKQINSVNNENYSPKSTSFCSFKLSGTRIEKITIPDLPLEYLSIF
ncbi:MAG: hypothetical protein EOO43_05350 [Flavobacterium sp.]|nr:MAG: hypothetical protein EOO43_05350 [Flavobacterium sp.]